MPKPTYDSWASVPEEIKLHLVTQATRQFPTELQQRTWVARQLGLKPEQIGKGELVRM